MPIGGVVIQFRADADRAERSIDGLRRSMGRLDDDAKRGTSGFSRLTDTLGKGLPVAGAVAGGILAAGAALVEFGKAAYDDQQAARKLARSLDAIPGVTKKMIQSNADWIDSMEIATHMADDELRAAMSRMASATRDVADAQKLVTLALDASTDTGKTFQGVVDALAKAASGNTTALMRQFPWLKKNEDGSLSLASAVQQLEKRYGGAAKAAADNDPWTKIKVLWGQMKEALGQALLPVLDRFGAWFKDPRNQKEFKDFITTVGEMSYQLGTRAVKAIDEFIAWLKTPEGKKQLREWKALLSDLAVAAGACVDLMGKIMANKWAFSAAIKVMMGPLGQFYELAKQAWYYIQWAKDGFKRTPRMAGPTGGGDFGRAAPTLARTVRSVPRLSGATGPQIIVQAGVGDPVAIARTIRQVLHAENVRNGNPQGIAWAAY